VNKLSLGKLKCAYLVSFGLAPYFKSMLLGVKKSQDYVVLFNIIWTYKSTQLNMHLNCY